MAQCDNQRQEFEGSFIDLKNMKANVGLLTWPFTAEVDSICVNIQLELINLQVDHTLKETYCECHVMVHILMRNVVISNLLMQKYYHYLAQHIFVSKGFCA